MKTIANFLERFTNKTVGTQVLEKAYTKEDLAKFEEENGNTKAFSLDLFQNGTYVPVFVNEVTEPNKVTILGETMQIQTIFVDIQASISFMKECNFVIFKKLISYVPCDILARLLNDFSELMLDDSEVFLQFSKDSEGKYQWAEKYMSAYGEPKDNEADVILEKILKRNNGDWNYVYINKKSPYTKDFEYDYVYTYFNTESNFKSYVIELPIINKLFFEINSYATCSKQYDDDLVDFLTKIAGYLYDNAIDTAEQRKDDSISIL